MNQLKPYFVLPFLASLALASVHALVMLVIDDNKLAWGGALLAMLPMLGFMAYLSKAGRGRTSRHLPLQLGAALGGGILVAVSPATLPAIYAWGLGLGGTLLYVYWYSRLQRPPGSPLAVGNRFPEFALRNAAGETVGLGELAGQRSLLLFYRGNWCPLCVAQIEELASDYRELESRGVRVCFISPQSQQETAELASRFRIPAHFLVDTDNRLARQLMIEHEGGIPRGMGMDDADTVLPTAVILDSDGTIAWVDATDNYRVRPEPATFFRVLDQLA